MIETRPLAKFGIETAVLCDQVRREDNGKLILIGVYAGGVLLNSYPTTLSLAGYVEGQILEPGFFETEFQFIDGEGAAMSPEIKVTSGERQFVVGPFGNNVSATLTFQKSGDCILRVKQDGAWKNLFSKPVKLKKEVTSSQVSPKSK